MKYLLSLPEGKREEFRKRFKGELKGIKRKEQPTQRCGVK